MAYSPAIWAKIQTAYEAGISIPELSQRHGVSIPAIKRRSVDWKKGSLIPLIQEQAQEKTIDTLARLGMPKEKALKILIEGMEDPEMTQFEGKGDQMIATPMKDYKLILGYLKEYLSITDSYPAQRIEIDIREVQTKIVAVLVEFRDSLPEDKREYFKTKIEEALA